MRRAVLACLLLVACGSSGRTGDVGAIRACQEAVRARLKAPSTASFEYDRTVQVTPSKDGKGVIVVSYVDAENGFGAHIRQTFGCKAQPSANGQGWDVVGLEMPPT